METEFACAGCAGPEDDDRHCDTCGEHIHLEDSVYTADHGYFCSETCLLVSPKRRTP